MAGLFLLEDYRNDWVIQVEITQLKSELFNQCQALTHPTHTHTHTPHTPYTQE